MRGYRSALAAGALALAVAGSTSLFWSAALSADQQRHMSSFGRALAEQLATLSAAPLIGGDRISLSVLATRINEPAEVASVSIYTIDDRVLAIPLSAASWAKTCARDTVRLAMIRLAADSRLRARTTPLAAPPAPRTKMRRSDLIARGSSSRMPTEFVLKTTLS